MKIRPTLTRLYAHLSPEARDALDAHDPGFLATLDDYSPLDVDLLRLIARLESTEQLQAEDAARVFTR
jgi:hypothetical protein